MDQLKQYSFRINTVAILCRICFRYFVVAEAIEIVN